MADRIQALRQAAQARHEQTLRRAEAALASLARHGKPVTVSGVAGTARVSRSWIYQQPQLLAEINRLRQPGPGSRPSSARCTNPAITDLWLVRYGSTRCCGSSFCISVPASTRTRTPGPYGTGACENAA